MDAHRFLRCESELRVRSYGLFHLIYEGDGPRQRILRNNISVESRSPPYTARPKTPIVERRQNNFILYGLAAGGSNPWQRYTCGLDLNLDRPDNSKDA